MGEDVGVDGGVFRVTEDLHRKFGSKRVIDSPLAEAAIIGAGVGMALYGLKPVCEIQFSGFAFQCFHQIENHVARYRMRSQGRFHVPMVIRMPYGGGVRALEHHSESEEQFYAHIPGLKMVIPSGPRNARALLVERHPRSRSGDLLRAQGPLPRGQGRRPRRDRDDAARPRPGGARGSRPHADRLRRHAPAGPRGGRHAGRGRRRAVRGHRSADDLAAGPRDPRGLGAEDRPRGHRARGAAQLRARRGDRRPRSWTAPSCRWRRRSPA